MEFDVVIIGSGLAGLTAANYLAKEGKSAVILEKSDRLGGRAMTNHDRGALFNIGAHALYTGGEAATIFNELGIEIRGKDAFIRTHGILNNEVVPFATGMGSLLKSPMLSWTDKMQFMQLIVKIWKMNADKVPNVSLQDWAENEIKSLMVKQHFYALCRTTTYTHAPMLQNARPVLRQLQRTLKTKVIYVDGGWERIVEQLTKKAKDAGVKIMDRHRALNIDFSQQEYKIIRCADGEVYKTENVIIAIPPQEVMRLIEEPEKTFLGKWIEQTVPITATCLDLSLTHLPNPHHQFVLGIDQPIFFTNEFRAAKVCEEDQVVAHLVKYHDPLDQDCDSKTNKEQLENMMDLIQPGWRSQMISQQFLPKITVVYDFPRINRNDYLSLEVQDIPGLYIAGDWAGGEELLANAAAASGKRAALHILEKSKILV